MVLKGSHLGLVSYVDELVGILITVILRMIVLVKKVQQHTNLVESDLSYSTNHISNKNDWILRGPHHGKITVVS